MAVVSSVDVGRNSALKRVAASALDRKTLFLNHLANFAIGRRIGVLLLIALLSFLTVYPLAMLLYGSLHSNSARHARGAQSRRLCPDLHHQ